MKHKRRQLGGCIARFAAWRHDPRPLGDSPFGDFDLGDDGGLVSVPVHQWKTTTPQLCRPKRRECDELKGVQWKWQAADCMLGKARFGGALLVPTPPIAGKMARKRAW